ncbi:hypothetical protein LCGC14_1509730 [marine sediment metagenome]|uniref:Uncharacterized protein n=1 Tax=marine sediment metagenome TaxID=412755 RepID=A0A0F9JMG6_9ZZZZ
MSVFFDATEVVAGIGFPALERVAVEAHRQECNEQNHHQPMIPTHCISVTGREVR